MEMQDKDEDGDAGQGTMGTGLRGGGWGKVGVGAILCCIYAC